MFWIGFGDIHEQCSNLSRLPGLSEALGVILSGDLTNRGTRQAAQQVIESVAVHNPRILAQVGNMDTDAVTEYLENQGINLHRQVHNLFSGAHGVNIGVMGVGYSTPTPFATPNEVEEVVIKSWIWETYEKASQYDHLVAVIHEPPINSALDRIGPGNHVGSQAVREFLEQADVDVCITGHIHESRGIEVINGTTVINPGPLASGGFVKLEFDGHNLSATLETF